MPYLVVTWKGEEIHRVNLRGPVVIGREEGVDLRINDPALSRKHCRVEPTLDGSWQVTDLQSRNGVYVHGQKVDRCFLVDGFEFRICNGIATFYTGPFMAKRSATPHEALFVSNPLRPDLALKPRESLANEATIAHVHEPIVPSEVNLDTPADQPVVQPFALPFQRPKAKPVLADPEATQKIEAMINPQSRRRLGDWLRTLRKRSK